MAHAGSAGSAYSEAVRKAIASPDLRQPGRSPFTNPASSATSVIRQSFTVTGESPGLQMLAWRDYVGRILDVPISRMQMNQGFLGEIDSYVLKDIRYLDSRTDPVSQFRTGARISSDNVTDYVFHVTVDGIAETQTSQQRKSTQFMPGILVLDMAQTMSMRRPTRARAQAFFLPRAMVESAIPAAESLHGSVLSCTTPLTRLLCEHLLSLRQDLPAMRDADAESALITGAQLMLAVFGKMTRLSHTARSAARAAMLGRIKRYIGANLRSPTLEPDTILRGFPLARPTLYRMFEPEGGLHAYIRNCRLREAADQLLRAQTETVASIADGLGFSHASDFTRAFRRAYGLAPQEFRAAGLDWLRD